MSSVLAACGGELNAPLDPYQELAAHLSEMIIPETDTPGAKSAGVPTYIQAVIREFFTEEEQISFKAGLDGINLLAQESGASSFVKANSSQQMTILERLDQGEEGLDSSTWKRLKSLTIFGYYTSEAATQELAYEQIPGRFVGCIPFEDVGRAWLDRGV